ncbi:P-loop NTPase fold protein [Micromonospora sp. NBC_01638]|nr:P-loop NTPase fold protein [Micromonospora sp. NBC_01638]
MAGTIQIWDPEEGVLVREIQTGHVAAVRALTSWWTGAGEWRFASSGPDGVVRLWNPATGARLGEIDTGHVSGVWALTSWAVPGGGHRIASGGLDGHIRVWDSESLHRVGDSIVAHSASVAALSAWRTADGAYRLASAGDDGAVRVWNPEAGTAVCSPMLGDTGGVLALSPWRGSDGRQRLASAGTDGVVRIWDPETGDLIGSPLTGHASGIWSLASWSGADGTVRLAAGGFDGRVYIWDTEAQVRLGEPLGEHTTAVLALTAWVRPDGAVRLASGGADAIRVWDVETGAVVGVPLHGHSAAVRALVWIRSPQGEVQVASGADDGAVMLWDPESGMAVRTIEVAAVSMWGLSDTPADTDLLDRRSLAEAVVAQLCRPTVDPLGHRDDGPAVVTIEGPWGSGKTTLMRMVQQLLPTPEVRPEPEQRQLRIRAVLRQLKAPHVGRRPAQAQPHGGGGEAPSALSVWFNPWAYQSGDQIWAGLTKAIIDAAEPVLYPTTARREQYWLSHNGDRVDRHRLRRTIQRRVISPLLGIAVAATAFPLVIGLVEANQVFRVFGVPVTTAVLALLLPAVFLLAGLVHTAVRYQFGLAADYLPAELLRGPVTGAHLELGKAAPADRLEVPLDPLQCASSGSLYLDQHDVNALLADIAAVGPRVVVFIDDLDRCRAATTAEVFEAINIFLFGLTATSSLPCQFVIGLDPVIVAAHLDHVYRDLQAAGVGLHGDDPSPGWAFLRKLVQLPVLVPRLDDGGVERFVQAVTGGEFAPLLPAAAALQPQLGQAPPTPRSDGVNRSSVDIRPFSISGKGAQREPVRHVTVPWRTMEQHPSVRQFIAERLAAQPERSVREAKRQLNVWQLYERMLSRQEPMTDPQTSIGRAQRLFQFAEIVTRWPALLPYLRKRVDGTSGIALLATAAAEDQQWLYAVDQLELNPVPHARALENLRSILVTADAAGIVELAERLL